MKLRDLKERINKLEESRLDDDVMIGCGVKTHHTLFAKSINYNKRDGLFTPRVFLIQTGEQK